MNSYSIINMHIAKEGSVKKLRGFTLIELLIAIAIVGILAAVAYPSYIDSVSKSRRADAKAALLGFAQAMERHYTTEGTYAGAAEDDGDTGSPAIFSTTSPLDGTDVYYNLEIESATSNTYVIGAEPTGAQDGDGILVLLSTGERAWDSEDTANGDLSDYADIGDDYWTW